MNDPTYTDIPSTASVKASRALINAALEAAFAAIGQRISDWGTVADATHLATLTLADQGDTASLPDGSVYRLSVPPSTTVSNWKKLALSTDVGNVDLSTLVHLAGAETVTGDKNFTGALTKAGVAVATATDVSTAIATALNNLSITGQYLGSSSTFTGLPTTDVTSHAATNGDWAALTADVVGTGSAGSPQYPRGVYVYSGTAFTFAFALSAGAAGMVGANNLSEVTNPAAARTNLGLGSAATQAASAFDAAGAASAAQSTAQTYADSKLVSKAFGMPINNPKGLVHFTSRLNEALFSRLPICCVGDSITFGQGADNNNVAANVPDNTQGWVGQLRTLLAATYGDPGEGFLFANDSRITPSGATAIGTTGPLHQNYQLSGGSASLSFTIPSGTSFVGVIQNNLAGDTSARYSVDSATAASVTTLSGTGVPVETKITVDPATSHTFVLYGPASGQTNVMGFTLRKGSAGVAVHRIGVPGYVASDLIGGSSDGVPLGSSGQQDRMAKAAWQWESIPGLCVVSFLANDWQNQQSLVTISDGAITSGSPSLGSPSAQFNIFHVGRTIVSGAGIPTSTTITAVSSDGKTATMSANATGTATGLSVGLGHLLTDKQSGITPTLYNLYISQFIAPMIAAGWSILFLGQNRRPEVGVAPAPPYLASDYIAQLDAIVAANPGYCARIDVADIWGTPANAISLGLQFSGSVHPMRAGYGSIARIVHDTIRSQSAYS